MYHLCLRGGGWAVLRIAIQCDRTAITYHITYQLLTLRKKAGSRAQGAGPTCKLCVKMGR